MKYVTSLVPSIISSSTDYEVISICETYICQVSRMSQKTFVFALKEITSQGAQIKYTKNITNNTKY